LTPLAAAIVFYDYRHKGHSFAPVVMGLCRALVYCVAAAAASGVNAGVIIAGAVMLAYVTALTVVARTAGAHARWLVPLLIAGIALVDAAVVGVASGFGPLVVLAAAAFPLTLMLQRVIPGD
jgi:hypothetical protein